MPKYSKRPEGGYNVQVDGEPIGHVVRDGDRWRGVSVHGQNGSGRHQKRDGAADWLTKVHEGYQAGQEQAALQRALTPAAPPSDRCTGCSVKLPKPLVQLGYDLCAVCRYRQGS